MTSDEPQRAVDEHLWARPIPTIGDSSSAAQRAGDRAGWAFDAATREALATVLAARRDIRRYRPDAVAAGLVDEVLAAGHAAPSVGQSQPWRFIVVRDPRIRERVAVMSDRERLRQAAQLSPQRARQLLDLQLEGIREAPLGIVVACDRRTPAQGILGRNTFHDADMWSCACAIENMWLTARGAGLGMGWVTLMRPWELAGLLGLPAGVETLGWLCLGWPDERPPFPGLERRGWSRRLPLRDVVMTDRWPHDAPPPPASGLATTRAGDEGEPAATVSPGDLVRSPSDSRLRSDLVAPGPRRVVHARDRADLMLTAPGSLGVLDQALDRLVAVCGEQVATGTLVIAAADHPVVGRGVSAFDPAVTREVMAASVEGVALGALTARTAGLDVVLVDAGIEGPPLAGTHPMRPRGPRGDLVAASAMTIEDTTRLVDSGRALGASLAAHGLVCLGEIGVGNTTVAAALACALCEIAPELAAGLGAGADSAMMHRKATVVAAALGRVDCAALRRDPVLALAELGGPEFAVLAGVVVGAAQAGAMVVLDGLATSVAALAAVEVNPAVQSHLVAGQVSREGIHPQVLTELGLEPVLDLRLRAGEGVGACLAAQILLTGLQLRRNGAHTR
ncbi:nicotinate-nucleotide--dimethylbenzimidazole phosphoribosyltransferase [Propionibacterium cyclohexanicum]|uniref:Nicotinate-nucleotide--dimethylbenzimidazole phosphoribosyltransferase n=1 Tax=Propionibacterium cyclohexanicum TaxID=64702 RepID=A0A1H9S7I2_9ACTN|nr:5,6-dimethylbenzimidazole synthase [Propionibacterium cyclohexanicum]SER80944.1 nicotinate-nucleotide--dimethylbenzimidazole phosphoribosyltransferase [Propionibacterium cyclohexanicum]